MGDETKAVQEESTVDSDAADTQETSAPVEDTETDRMDAVAKELEGAGEEGVAVESLSDASIASLIAYASIDETSSPEEQEEARALAAKLEKEPRYALLALSDFLGEPERLEQCVKNWLGDCCKRRFKVGRSKYLAGYKCTGGEILKMTPKKANSLVLAGYIEPDFTTAPVKHEVKDGCDCNSDEPDVDNT
jgi:hypothetical protein